LRSWSGLLVAIAQSSVRFSAYWISLTQARCRHFRRRVIGLNFDMWRKADSNLPQTQKRQSPNMGTTCWAQALQSLRRLERRLSQVRERLAIAASKNWRSRISARRSRWRTRRKRPALRTRTDLRLPVCHCNFLAPDFQLKNCASLFFGKRRLDVADRVLIAGYDVVLEGVDALLRLALLIQ